MPIKHYSQAKKAPFGEQLLFYRSHSIYGMNESSNMFTENVGLPGFDRKRLLDLEAGIASPSKIEIERFLEVLGPVLRSVSDGLDTDRRGTLEAFREAAEKSQTIGQIMRDFGEAHGATTYKKIGELIGFSETATRRFIKNCKITHRESALKIADKMGLTGNEYQDFLWKAGRYLTSDASVFRALETDSISLQEAIRSMRDIRGWDNQAFAEHMKIPRSTVQNWVTSPPPPRLPTLPSLVNLKRMVSPACFNLVEDKENYPLIKRLFEDVGFAYDVDHVAEMLKQGDISMFGLKQAVELLMLVKYSTVPAYCKACNHNHSGAYRRINNSITKKDLLPLVEGGSRASQEYLFEAAGNYIDTAHVIKHFKDSAQLHLFIEALKQVNDISNNALTIGSATLEKTRNLRTTPKLTTLAQIFYDLRQVDSELAPHWEQYKEMTCAFLGHRKLTPAYSECKRSMDKALDDIEQKSYEKTFLERAKLWEEHVKDTRQSQCPDRL